MACLSNEKIELLAVDPDAHKQDDLWNHVARCSNCRMRVERVLGGTEVVRDIQELRQRRQSLKPLLEGMDTDGRAGGLTADDRV